MSLIKTRHYAQAPWGAKPPAGENPEAPVAMTIAALHTERVVELLSEEFEEETPPTETEPGT